MRDHDRGDRADQTGARATDTISADFPGPTGSVDCGLGPYGVVERRLLIVFAAEAVRRHRERLRQSGLSKRATVTSTPTAEMRSAPEKRTPAEVIRTHRSLAFTLCVLVVGVGTGLILMLPRSETPGFTGVAVTVPACPTDDEGCRVFVTRASDGSPAAHQDWSGGNTVLNIALPAGRYSIAAQGCRGDSIEMPVVTVAPSFHTAVDLGVDWQLPKFLGRVCPGFIPSTPRLPG